MEILITILEFLGVLAVVVIVHEFGHFATAKAFGIRVNEFGFGFPPRLLGLRRGETVYTLNLLPLGGFVKLEGENDPTDPRSLASKGVGTRFLVLVAGSFMNVVLAVVLLSGLFMFTVGVIRVADVSPGSPADLARLLPGDTIIDVNGNRVESFEELVNEVHPNRGTEVEWRIRRGDNRLAVSLVPQINHLSEELATGISVDTMGERRVESVASGSPAESAGVLAGDVILQINGSPVDSLHQLTSAINSNRGNEVEWLVRRESTQQKFRLVPRLDPVPGQGATGITVDIVGDIQVKQVAPGSPAALAGVVPGDTIVDAGGNSVRSFSDLVSSVRRDRGQETDWLIRRGDLELTLRLVPRESTLPKEVATGITVDYVGLQGRPVHPPLGSPGHGIQGHRHCPGGHEAGGHRLGIRGQDHRHRRAHRHRPGDGRSGQGGGTGLPGAPGRPNKHKPGNFQHIAHPRSGRWAAGVRYTGVGASWQAHTPGERGTGPHDWLRHPDGGGGGHRLQ